MVATMDEETKAAEPLVEQKNTKERSTIEFPYLDEENAMEVAEGVHHVGGICDIDQLAAQLGQSAQGGGFRLRLICARQFGLIEYERGRVSLTPLGHRAVDPQQHKAAKAEAFLQIPLYKALFDNYRGVTLPPNSGLELKMISLGVAPKQADKARQAFQRSAKYAGYFEYGADRLVAPPNNGGQPAKTFVEEQKPEIERENSGLGGQSLKQSYDLHPFVQGLIEKLPPPDGTWSLTDRAKWLTTAANIFDLMYASEDAEGGLTVRLEGKTLSILREPAP